MSSVTFRTKCRPIFRIFHILKTDRMTPFCNLFMERPPYFSVVDMLDGRVLELMSFTRRQTVITICPTLQSSPAPTLLATSASSLMNSSPFLTESNLSQETQLSLRDRATRACQLKSGKVLHKCRRLVFEKL